VFTQRGQPARTTSSSPNASIAFFDDRGNQVASLKDQGPIFLARLPDGRYTIVVEHDGRRQTRQVDVRNGRTKVVNFLWS
jgi:hypothetical protein